MTGKRLFQYALNMKGTIIIALFLLTIAVVAEVLSPLVAKNVIDNHILGIEDHWVETEDNDKSVEFAEKYYTRATYVEEEKPEISATILQSGRSFYFIDEEVSLEGKRSIENGIMTITYDGKIESYEARKLTIAETMNFYNPEIPTIVKLIVIYFGLFVIAGVFRYGQYVLLQVAANRIIQKMRNALFKKTQTLPISYFDNVPAGKIVARITNDTEAIRDLYVAVLSNFFTGFVYLIGIYTVMFILDARLAVAFTLLIPIVIVWMFIYRKFAAKYNHVIRSKNSEINAMINETIQGLPIIQAFGRQNKTASEFEHLNNTHFEYQNKLLVLNSLSSGNLVGTLQTIVFVIFIWYFGGAYLSGELAVTIGVLYAFVDYIIRLFNPIYNIVNQFANLERAMVAGERVFKLLDEPGIPVSDEKMKRYQGNVSFRNVYFGYKEGEYVLKDINIEAKHGETIAFVGHTGSGKSSLMNLLFRFYDVNKGKIIIDGKNIQDIPHQTLRDHMAIVLQDPYLFTGTIYSNISLNDPRITREKAESALKAVGADRVLRHLEKGLDEPVIEKGSTLSSGERQLISFARALAFDPAILILDEATSNIDTETENIIQHAMEVLKQGRTTFIIAHRLSTIKNADEIYVLDKGSIVEQGTHDMLMERKGKYFQMYQLQQGNLINQVS